MHNEFFLISVGGYHNVLLQVFVSHHSDIYKQEFYSDNVKPKTDVKKLGENTVTFVDGSVEKIDAILYCTGN